jgi:peroxiredoxin
MLSGKRSWATLIAVCLMAGVIGCNGDTPETTNGGTPGNDDDPPVADDTNNDATSADAPTSPQVPETIYSEMVGKTHVVKVGDTLPAAELPDVGGKLHKLSDLYGEKLTIIFFWKGRNIYSVAEFEDMEGDVALPYYEKGVRVIAINEGDTAEQVFAQIQKVDAKFANVLDPGGDFLAKLATEKMTRTYAIDGEGKILWFDWEYSPSTRRAMKQTIEAVLIETTPEEEEGPAL